MDVFISSHGRRLAASIHEPKGEDLHSLTVLLPGILDSKDYVHLVRLGEDLAEVGITAVRFDPTGVWKSEGKIEEYCISLYLKDLKLVLSDMKDRDEYVQTVLVGHSMGGMIALLHAAYENDVDAVVGIMFPSSITQFRQWQGKLEDWIKSGYKISSREIPDDLTKQRDYRVPYTFIEDANQYDVLGVVDELRMPLLFIAAENDEGISVGEVEEVFKKAHEPKKFVIIKNAGHRYWNDSNHLKKVNKAVLKFLEEYSLI